MIVIRFLGREILASQYKIIYCRGGFTVIQRGMQVYKERSITVFKVYACLINIPFPCLYSLLF